METSASKRMHLLSGSYSLELARQVAGQLDLELGALSLSRFANGEISCRIEESVRGSNVFVLQTHSLPVNEAIMEQAIIIDAAKRASASRITAVCPFFGYARQDRKSGGREPITAKLVTDMLHTAGADRIVSIDLHSGQIQGFFSGPFDHLTAMPVLRHYLEDHFGSDIVIVSPDAGRVKMSERYVRALNADLAIVHKRRSTKTANTVEALDVIGSVKGRTCVVIDDMIDTAGTLCAAAEQLKKRGAKTVYAMATHPILSPPAAERLADSSIDRIIVTDTLPLPSNIDTERIEVISIAPLLANAIAAIFHGHSVSSIFDGDNQL